MTSLFVEPGTACVPIEALTKADLPAWRAAASPRDAAWADAIGFEAKPRQHALVPTSDGGLGRVLLGIDSDEPMIWRFAALPSSLPPGEYALPPLTPREATQAALGWALGDYAFEAYKRRPRPSARLAWPEGADRAEIRRLAAAIRLARDLVNTPADAMGPSALAAAAATLAERHGARFRAVVGDDLLAGNYPLIHAVGRAAADPPRLVELLWGEESAPKVTLVGKGVCFDSGGLDIKPAGNMRIMKKDMGGAAMVLGLADAIMDRGLPVRLRVLVPAVENMIAGNAMRPLDVVRARSGKTVEIGNTDAEGRLILCDALTDAAEERPSFLLDAATLTGAARVALGPDLPALFTHEDELAAGLLAAATAEADPLWRLPLWRPYAKMLESKVADINNVGESPFAGAILAALYLDAFVPRTIAWAHLDLYAWNASGRPGRPEGGEAQALRAVYAYLAGRYG